MYSLLTPTCVPNSSSLVTTIRQLFFFTDFLHYKTGSSEVKESKSNKFLVLLVQAFDHQNELYMIFCDRLTEIQTFGHTDRQILKDIK